MGDANTTIGHLISQVREFLEERNWEKYHNPKDIAESISIEAAELLQLFQWVKSEESQQFKSDSLKVQRIREELADVVLYCLSMANTLYRPNHCYSRQNQAEQREIPCRPLQGKSIPKPITCV